MRHVAVFTLLALGCAARGQPDLAPDELLARLRSGGLAFEERWRGPSKGMPAVVDIQLAGAPGLSAGHVRLRLCRSEQDARERAAQGPRGSFAWGRYSVEGGEADAARVRAALPPG